jgi:hypothetical protein
MPDIAFAHRCGDLSSSRLSRLALSPAALVREVRQHGRGTFMAAEGEAEQAARAHQKSYNMFAALMKWGAIISLVTALLVILIIRN